jgi:hypothetical protein
MAAWGRLHAGRPKRKRPGMTGPFQGRFGYRPPYQITTRSASARTIGSPALQPNAAA